VASPFSPQPLPCPAGFPPFHACILSYMTKQLASYHTRRPKGGNQHPPHLPASYKTNPRGKSTRLQPAGKLTVCSSPHEALNTPDRGMDREHGHGPGAGGRRERIVRPTVSRGEMVPAVFEIKQWRSGSSSVRARFHPGGSPRFRPQVLRRTAHPLPTFFAHFPFFVLIPTRGYGMIAPGPFPESNFGQSRNMPGTWRFKS
jgi:hypothetical protein